MKSLNQITCKAALLLVLTANLGYAQVPPPPPPKEPLPPKAPAIEMVFVQGGSFTMGCTNEQGDDCSDWEKPARKVTVYSFNIGKYPVTQGQWKAVMGNNPSQFSKGDNYPVENVSYEDALEFIFKLSVLTGKRYRLPEEREWEYAARGGSKSKGYKFSGSNNMNDVGWHEGNSGESTHPVGAKQPNELGIYDMSGNVWEWCSDWNQPYPGYKDNSTAGKLQELMELMGGGGEKTEYPRVERIVRGGSWYSKAKECRVPTRGMTIPQLEDNGLGFRLVLPE